METAVVTGWFWVLYADTSTGCDVIARGVRAYPNPPAARAAARALAGTGPAQVLSVQDARCCWPWCLYGGGGGEGLTDGEELVDLAVVPQVRLVELAGCLHDVEDQAQLGEHPPHGLVDPGAARQRGHGLVEAHVLGSDPDPVAGRGRRLRRLHGLPDPVHLRRRGARRALHRRELQDPPDAVQVPHVVHVEQPDEHAAVQLVHQ